MDVISTFFLDGRIACLVLAVMLAEALLLFVLSRRSTSHFSAASIASALLPGFFLVLALLVALTRAAWFWIALALIGALVTHLIDMRLRFQSRTAPSLNR